MNVSAVFVDGQSVSMTPLEPETTSPGPGTPTPNLQVEVAFTAAGTRPGTTLAVAATSTIPEGGCNSCQSFLYFACQSDEFFWGTLYSSTHSGLPRWKAIAAQSPSQLPADWMAPDFADSSWSNARASRGTVTPYWYIPVDADFATPRWSNRYMRPITPSSPAWTQITSLLPTTPPAAALPHPPPSPPSLAVGFAIAITMDLNDFNATSLQLYLATFLHVAFTDVQLTVSSHNAVGMEERLRRLLSPAAIRVEAIIRADDAHSAQVLAERVQDLFASGWLSAELGVPVQVIDFGQVILWPIDESSSLGLTTSSASPPPYAGEAPRPGGSEGRIIAGLLSALGAGLLLVCVIRSYFFYKRGGSLKTLVLELRGQPPPLLLEEGFTERSSNGKPVAFPPAVVDQSSADAKQGEAEDDDEDATAAPPRITSDLEAPRTSLLLDASRQKVLEDVELELTEQVSRRHSSSVSGRASMVSGRASIAAAPVAIEGREAPAPTAELTVGRPSEREVTRKPGERRGSVENTKVSSLKSSQV